MPEKMFTSGHKVLKNSSSTIKSFLSSFLCHLIKILNFSTFWKTSFAEGKSDKEILDHLLKDSRYDKRLLPPVDGKIFLLQF